MKIIKTAIFMISFSFFTCVHGPEDKGHSHHHNHVTGQEHPIDQNLTIGKTLNAHRYSDIYFSAQPSDADFALIKSQGFKTIVNLRMAQENEYTEVSEKALVESLGLNYEHIPADPHKPLTDEFIDKVSSAVKKHRGSGKILIHCSSGNRVGMWLGGHFHKDHKLSKEKSLNLAKKLGLTNDPVISKVKDYLKKQP